MKSAAFITGEGFQTENVGRGGCFKTFEEYTPLILKVIPQKMTVM